MYRRGPRGHSSWVRQRLLSWSRWGPIKTAKVFCFMLEPVSFTWTSVKGLNNQLITCRSPSKSVNLFELCVKVRQNRETLSKRGAHAELTCQNVCEYNQGELDDTDRSLITPWAIIMECRSVFLCYGVSGRTSRSLPIMLGLKWVTPAAFNPYF